MRISGPGTRWPGGRPSGGVTVAAIVTTLVLVGVFVGVAVPGRAVALRAPGAIPDAKLDALIHTDQIELVTVRQVAAVAAARTGLADTERTLAGDQAAVRRAELLSTNASEVRTQATLAVQHATVALGVARAAHHDAVDATSLVRRQLQTLAVGWYIGGASLTPSSRTPLADAQAATDADTELQLLTGLTSARLRRDSKHQKETSLRLAAATSTLHADRRARTRDVDEAANAATVLAAATRTVAADLGAVRTGTTTLDAAVAAESAAVAALDGPEGTKSRPVPTILGRSALTAAEIVAWFRQMGYVAGTRDSVGRLADLYLSEGRAEDVRGDIAFAQAIVETGEFDSPDAIERNNYAGIAHCDSCAGGLRFASPLAGVRSQIQLLRTFADRTLTSAQLPSPPPVAALAPQDQAVRGCCRTWNALTGVWASDSDYGSTVLAVYAEMLTYAVSQVPGPQGQPAGGTASAGGTGPPPVGTT